MSFELFSIVAEVAHFLRLDEIAVRKDVDYSFGPWETIATADAQRILAARARLICKSCL